MYSIEGLFHVKYKGIYYLLGLQNNRLLFNGILLQCVHQRFAENSIFGINIYLNTI